MHYLKYKTVWMVILACAAVCGCGGSEEQDFLNRSVSPSSLVSQAMQQSDTNGDGQLDAAELESCISLRDSLSAYDTDGDGAISQAELLARIEQLFKDGVILTNVSCTVTKGRSPVSNARVVFEPAPFMESVLEPASGVTDSSGVALIAVADDRLPDELKGKPVMHIGLYEVTIDSGSNTTKFGHEVDPDSRTGVSPTFDLTSARKQ
ncbi:hypothetical protein NG895_10430 [Aeoliella sp. ICT_H6.2]|uniref:EF-hand domain-containing protein n=1 Tax=Aeoliella straminimaris TaxID=2954799 RepID=A0A9X2JGF3_9BACT|nr:hypothetical protein [Aeoliella straminimaris]